MAVATFDTSMFRPLLGAIAQRFKAAAASMTPGQAVYVSGADGDRPIATIADANAAASAEAVGIIAGVGKGKESSAAGDTLSVVTSGPVTGFTGLTPGAKYYVSITAGKINVALDAVSGDFIWIVGRALSATVLDVNPFTYDVVVIP